MRADCQIEGETEALNSWNIIVNLKEWLINRIEKRSLGVRRSHDEYGPKLGGIKRKNHMHTTHSLTDTYNDQMYMELEWKPQTARCAKLRIPSELDH